MDFKELKEIIDQRGAPDPVSEEDIKLFKKIYRLSIPEDLQAYFKIFNRTVSNYGPVFMEFYTFNGFLTVKEAVGDFGGVPDYRKIVETMPFHANCFVFADYSINVITYAIRLHDVHAQINEVYAICGAVYKKVADSFSEFIQKYLANEDIYI